MAHPKVGANSPEVNSILKLAPPIFIPPSDPLIDVQIGWTIAASKHCDFYIDGRLVDDQEHRRTAAQDVYLHRRR